MKDLEPKVLVVEDNPVYATGMRLAARSAWPEAKLDFCTSAGDALVRVKEVNYDLIFLDIGLAGERSGLDVLSEIREQKLSQAPVCVITGNDITQNLAEQTHKAGSEWVMSKPPIKQLPIVFKVLRSEFVETAI